VNLQIWQPERNVAVDKSIVRFTGRAVEITTVLNKPTPTGIKVWNLGQRGFLLQWNWHRPGSKFGPVKVKIPPSLKGNKTQAVVLHLLKQLPPAQYHVYLNNLFTSYVLIKLLRSEGFGATGTYKTNTGVISELIDIKKNNKGKDKMLWGTLISMPTASGLVNQYG
jgi:hypothetical protein